MYSNAPAFPTSPVSRFLRTEIGRPLGMAVEAISLVESTGARIISSSAIRAALQKPDLSAAEALLGRPHIISGLVVTGDKRGRQLNFPTANIVLDDKLSPAFGVYAVTAGLERIVPASIIFFTAPQITGLMQKMTPHFSRTVRHALLI